MLNPLHTNRIKVVHVFDWACGNIIRSLACNLWYVLATLGTTYTLLIAVAFCSLRDTMACLGKNCYVAIKSIAPFTKTIGSR